MTRDRGCSRVNNWMSTLIYFGWALLALRRLESMTTRIVQTITILFLLVPTVLQAQGSAGQAGEFLRWGVGSKALGLGRAFTSVADDASALYWNPAGLSALSRIGGTFMFTHVPMNEGASFNYLASAIPLRLFFVNSTSTSGLSNFLQDLKLGVGVLWHSLGEFEFYNEDGSRAADPPQTSVDQSAIYFSISYPLNRLFAKLPSSGGPGFFKGDLHIAATNSRPTPPGGFARRSPARSPIRRAPSASRCT